MLRVTKSVTVICPRHEVYEAWPAFDRFPEFMIHLESVTVSGDGRSHWVPESPGGRVEWHAELLEDRPGEFLAWESVEAASMKRERRVVAPNEAQAAGRRVLPSPPRKPRPRPEPAPSRDPADQPEAPPVREEYPGPQTSSDGEHIEPGQTRPSPTVRSNPTRRLPT